MRKVIGLALAAAFALAASSSARSDAVAVIDPKLAAEFVLNTCLPAMDDLQRNRPDRHEFCPSYTASIAD